MIDVGQAVEIDHPMALDFLRRDLNVILEFFSKKKVKVMTLQETYEYITAKDLQFEDSGTFSDEVDIDLLQEAMHASSEAADKRAEQGIEQAQGIEDAVFAN